MKETPIRRATKATIKAHLRRCGMAQARLGFAGQYEAIDRLNRHTSLLIKLNRDKAPAIKLRCIMRQFEIPSASEEDVQTGLRQVWEKVLAK
jgi:hypothetical protein